MESNYSIGVDFGTTTTKMSIYDSKSGLTEIIKIGDKQYDYMPSVVAFKETAKDGLSEPTVGEDAETTASGYYVIRGIKRYLNRDLGKLPLKFRSVGKDREVQPPDSGQWVKVVDIVSAIIKEASVRAIKDLSKDKKYAAISGPDFYKLPVRVGCAATADLTARKIICQAMQNAKFNKFKMDCITPEPILSALAYQRIGLVSPGDVALIYDFGGGTFDAAIVVALAEAPSSGENILMVFSAGGVPFCGGEDIDTEFSKYILTKMNVAEQGGIAHFDSYIAILNGQTVKGTLQQECKEFQQQCKLVKEQLSQMERVDYRTSIFGKSRAVIIDRDDLVHCINNVQIDSSTMVNSTHTCLLDVWRKARLYLRNRMKGECSEGFYIYRDYKNDSYWGQVKNLPREDLMTIVNKVIMTGGTSQIPFVQDELRKYLPGVIIEHSQGQLMLFGVSEGAALPYGAEWHSVASLPYSIVINDKKEYEAFELLSDDPFKGWAIGDTNVHRQINLTEPYNVAFEYLGGGPIDQTLDLGKLRKGVCIEIDDLGCCSVFNKNPLELVEWIPAFGHTLGQHTLLGNRLDNLRLALAHVEKMPIDIVDVVRDFGVISTKEKRIDYLGKIFSWSDIILVARVNNIKVSGDKSKVIGQLYDHLAALIK
jgi:molecular chaperone DnaK (HSP70)